MCIWRLAVDQMARVGLRLSLGQDVPLPELFLTYRQAVYILQLFHEPEGPLPAGQRGEFTSQWKSLAFILSVPLAKECERRGLDSSALHLAGIDASLENSIAANVVTERLRLTLGVGGTAGSQSLRPQDMRVVPAPPTTVVMWEGAEPSGRNVVLARTRTAFLEAGGSVAKALAILRAGGIQVGKSAFYRHLKVLDGEIPGWREGIQPPRHTGSAGGMRRVGRGRGE